MKIPYDFIPGTDNPQEPGFVRVEPLPECAELGSHLDRFCQREYEATGRDTRCETCAFRQGTLAKSTMEGSPPFYCHETDRPCGGWVMLSQASPGKQRQ